ncbi:MAG TPA: tRNA pseudouridine(13) synthase TruD [Gammaproteobacteria bacterium]|nr:tRNA pseudouridine(13) synthase TruD [Gammaproteobacteria bacterium]
MFDPDAFARAHGTPPARGVLRSRPEDFVVDELPLVEPSGAGEHVLLHVQKRNTNTDWLARRLARFAGVRPVDVGYAGLKDRQALTTQWFSVRLAGRPEPDWAALELPDVSVLEHARHGRKLQRGALRGNRFTITLRSLAGDREAIEARLHAIAERGVPNYFGPQRFGHGAGNVEEAVAMLVEGRRVRDRHRRGLYLSAARAWLFNQVLAARVQAGTWDQALAGDVMILDGRRSHFSVDVPDETIAARLAQFDIHPSGPLWGAGERPVDAEALTIEDAALAGYAPWCDGLAKAGLKQERRALRLRVDDLTWTVPEPDTLQLSFALTAGAYATAVLREIVRGEG